MAAAANRWMRVARRNEIQNIQISLKKKPEKSMRKEKVTVAFDEESVTIDEEKYTEWKDGRKQN